MEFNHAPAMQYLVQATGYESTRSLEFLHNLVKQIRPKCVLELGTGFGASTVYMAKAIENGYVVSVDNYDGGYASSPNVINNNFLTKLGLSNKVVLLKGNTHQTRSTLEAAKLKIAPEILFMDADHGYEGLITEYNNIVPILPKEHIVVIDDLIANLPDVRNFLVDLMGRYEFCLSIKSFHWGMAVVCTSSSYLAVVNDIIKSMDKEQNEASVRQNRVQVGVKGS